MFETSNEIKKETYFIVTPARNEEDMLLDLANDIINQSIKPVMWVIVDDDSNDKTWSIIEGLRKNFHWIKGVRLGPRQDKIYAHERYKRAVRKGVNYAIEFCNKCNLPYHFIGMVDADIQLERRYFEKIIKAFCMNPRLGVASGCMYNIVTGKKESNLEISPKNLNEVAHIAGGALVFRKACYEMVSGFQDHIPSLVKAHIKNWDIKECSTARAFHRREGWSRKNYLYSQGNFMYSLNYHPINAVLTGIYDFIKISHSGGLSFLIGYFVGLFSRQRKIEDDEIREYYWNSFNRLVKRLLGKIYIKLGFNN